jgi:AraC-like DNA-binding protein
MKPQLINRTIIQNKSFNLESHCYKDFIQLWHYHPEIELIFIVEGSGTRFVGDSIEQFYPKEIVLLGKNLPHMWMYDKTYFKETSASQAKSLSFHFNDNFIEGLSKISEMADINSLFNRARRGIKFKQSADINIIQKVNEICELNGFDYKKIMSLLDVLNQLSEEKKYNKLSSPGYISSFKKRKNSRIMPVYKYIMNNITKDICLDKAANLACMNPSAFSRYFKRTHKKTFIRFVNEIKVGYACKLLLEQKFTISQVCFEAGFNNISNFNRQFKAIKQVTPSDFINLHRSIH